jgi:hypothetical protein
MAANPDDIPSNVRFAASPVNADGLTAMEEKKLKSLRSHRSRHELRIAYIEFKKKLADMDEARFLEEAGDRIHLSAFASNNPGSDYHWQCDLCYDESVRRGGKEAPLYKKAYEAVMKGCGLR